MAASAMSLADLEKDPRLFLYTSLTAGSSHIITATSRMETILKANKIPFQAIDTATDEKARRLWQRRAGQRKLPGLVKEGFVLGDLNEVEEWNEFGELKENIGPVPSVSGKDAIPAGGQVGVNIAPPLSGNSAKAAAAPINKAPQPGFDRSKAIPLPGAEEMAARNTKAKEATTTTTTTATPPPSTLEAINPETLTSSPEDKKESIEKAKEVASSEQQQQQQQHPAEEHLSAPASGIQSETASPKTAEEGEGEDTEEKERREAKEKHRGSHVIDAPQDEIKEIESANSLKEEEGEDAVSRGVADLTVGEDQKTQEQSAKEPEAASASVQD